MATEIERGIYEILLMISWGYGLLAAWMLLCLLVPMVEEFFGRVRSE